MSKRDPAQILESLYSRAGSSPGKNSIKDARICERIEYVAKCISNRAGVRLLMSCMLAKIDRPEIDPRCPYTEIAGEKSFSGRQYDEQYLTSFINKFHLPCNSTTAFLTPALRNMDSPLTKKTVIVGRPAQVYSDTLTLLDDVAIQKVGAEEVLTETLRCLIVLRDERKARIQSLVSEISRAKGALPLSSEGIVHLIEQHLSSPNSSRLPVLVVAAAYKAAADMLGERALPLKSHNAADSSTGALGDVEICLTNENEIVTIYEMKNKRVSINDVDHALSKINCNRKVDNYIFITTDGIDQDVREYAREQYELTGGVEIAILDCLGFLRHFLHLFHRIRSEFIDSYQYLLLAEPESAVNQPLKEAFLSLSRLLINA